MSKERRAAGRSGTPSDQKAHGRALARSVTLGQHGVTTSRHFKELMAALMSDVLSKAVDVDVANAVCNAGGKLVKMLELEFKFGSHKSASEDLTLSLTGVPAQSSAISAE